MQGRRGRVAGPVREGALGAVRSFGTLARGAGGAGGVGETKFGRAAVEVDRQGRGGLSESGGGELDEGEPVLDAVSPLRRWGRRKARGDAPLRLAHVVASDPGGDDSVGRLERLFELGTEPLVVNVPAQSSDKDGARLNLGGLGCDLLFRGSLDSLGSLGSLGGEFRSGLGSGSLDGGGGFRGVERVDGRLVGLDVLLRCGFGGGGFGGSGGGLGLVEGERGGGEEPAG